MPARVGPFRFSLLGLMALVAYVAMGCAALRYSTELWASALFSLAVLAQTIAVLGIVLRRNEARAAWIGFVVFGGGYLVLALILGPPFDLVSNRGLQWLEQKLHTPATSADTLMFTTVSGALPQGSPYPIAINSSSTATVTGNVVLWNAATGAQTPSGQTSFQRIGHSLISPLLGILGAWLALWLSNSNSGETRTSADKL